MNNNRAYNINANMFIVDKIIHLLKNNKICDIELKNYNQMFNVFENNGIEVEYMLHHMYESYDGYKIMITTVDDNLVKLNNQNLRIRDAKKIGDDYFVSITTNDIESFCDNGLNRKKSFVKLKYDKYLVYFWRNK